MHVSLTSGRTAEEHKANAILQLYRTRPSLRRLGTAALRGAEECPRDTRRPFLPLGLLFANNARIFKFRFVSASLFFHPCRRSAPLVINWQIQSPSAECTLSLCGYLDSKTRSTYLSLKYDFFSNINAVLLFFSIAPEVEFSIEFTNRRNLLWRSLCCDYLLFFECPPSRSVILFVFYVLVTFTLVRYRDNKPR